MSYSSFEELVADPVLRLEGVPPAHADIRRAIDSQLRELQSTTGQLAEARYLALMTARSQLEQLSTSSSTPEGRELVTLPSAVLERLISSLEGGGSTPAGRRDSAERFIELKTATLRRASQDFRRARTLPLAGLSGVLAAIWASKTALAVELPGISAGMFGGAATVVVTASLLTLIAAHRAQAEDEAFLRRLYDPDVHARALHSALWGGDLTNWEFHDQRNLLGVARERHRRRRARRDARDDGREGPSFLRSDFRNSLWIAADEVRPLIDDFPNSRYRRTRTYHALRSLLSRVDRVNAIEDAADAALGRYLELGVLSSRWNDGTELYYEAKRSAQ